MILMKIYESYTGENRDMVLHAYDYAKEAHRNQKRASGEPYFIHPCAVAEILTELGSFTRRHRGYTRYGRGHSPRVRRRGFDPCCGSHEAR